MGIHQMTYALIIIALVGGFFAGMKYGLTLESNAFVELRKIRAALVKTGVQFETYLSGDLHKIHIEATKVLGFPKAMVDFIKNELAIKVTPIK